MPPAPLLDRIQARLHRVDARVTPDQIAQLAGYVELLARWNRRINLTAFPMDDPSDEAMDRLIVEPVLAAAYVLSNDQTLMDLGSGGGSPAIPLKLMRPSVALVMVESRTRKSAFLREAVRELRLQSTIVENDRYETLRHRDDLRERMSLISFRAVRADDELWSVVRACLAPGGRVLWFRASAPAGSLPAGLTEVTSQSLGHADSWITVAARRT